MSQSDFVTRGQALVTSGQFQEAVKVCRLGLLGRPTTVEGRIVLGQALLALKRYDEVLAEMRVALELDHTSVQAQILKGDALLRKGDAQAALEVLTKAKPLAPEDPRLRQLLSEALRGGGPRPSASNPSVDFVGGHGEESTKHYPNHGADEEDTGTDPAEEDTGGEYTRPTSLSAPGSKKRSGRQQAMPSTIDPPPAAVLAVGDRSGTVEVDPDAEGVEVDEDDDFGALAAPPRSGQRGAASLEVPRGSVKSASRAAPKKQKPAPAPSKQARRGELSSVELDADDMVEIDESSDEPQPMSRRRGGGPGPGTAVRNAVKMPSGPIDLLPGAPQAATPASTRRTEQAPIPQPLAQMIAQQPHLMQVQPVNPRSAIAAALPTQAAVPLPGMMVQPASPMAQTVSPMAHVQHAQMHANAARPTVALNPAQQQSANAVEALFGAEPQPQPWQGQPQGRLAADDPTRQPGGLDPRIAVEPPSPGSFAEQGSASGVKPLKTGVRRGRSRLQVAMWILVGGLVIGGGVFAGFQIRALRLAKQIATARNQAVDLAKADTWQGWSGARDRLAGIVQASATIENRAALARARAVLSYEFGDALVDAKGAVERLDGAGGLDGAIATAYLSLALNDPKLAKDAAAKAVALAPDDPAVLYAAGQAAVLDGDLKTAITHLKSAQEREPRPLYAVGLARAIAMTGMWEDALAAVDRALGAMPDHPAALIQRAFLLAESGRINAGSTITSEIRAQLVKLIAEAGKPLAEQTRGISPAQHALANLALAEIDFALRDLTAMSSDIRSAFQLGVDDPRYAEQLVDTLYLVGQHAAAAASAKIALEKWGGNRRTRITQAAIAIAMGKAAEALDILARNPEAVAQPRGQAVRGHAHLALGEFDQARADFDAALKKLPSLELAVIGRAWIELQAGEIEEARKRIETRFNPNTSGIAMTTVYAAVLRMSPNTVDREKAKQLLDKAVTAPGDVSRAQLELARVYRDLGDLRGARGPYGEAAKTGNLDAQLELALVQIEDRDPGGGRDILDKLLRDAGPNATSTLLIEGARARMLAGDHAGASELLDRADKAPSTVRWQFDRERARLLLRRGDFAGASQFILKALEAADKDPETFVIGADIVGVDPKQTQLAGRLKVLVAQRLKDVPEGLIVTGKLALAADNVAEAETAYIAAAKALERTTPRRIAQAHFGLAVIAYTKGDDPTAQSQLELVMEEDPSIYPAYLFAAEIAKAKPATAIALVQKALTFNPEFAQAWYQLGLVAAKLGKRRELDEAITRLGALTPGSEQLKELQALRR